MPLTHIEHPEDTILTGDLSVLDAFTADNHYSVKIDGSPAIVWAVSYTHLTLPTMMSV